MVLDKKKISLMLLLLIMAYLESLKFIVFYAFKLENSRIDLIVLIAVMAYFYVMPSVKTSLVRFFSGFLLFSIIVPTAISQASHTLLYVAVTFCYSLLVLLVGGFILERNSAGEVFILSGLFQVVAIFASDKGILSYIIVNLVLALALNIQLNIIRIENDPRIRFVNGSGIKKNVISAASLIILISFSAVLFLFLKDGLVNANLHPVLFFSQKAASKTVNEDFWGKLQNFEFNGQVPVDDTPIMQVKSLRPAYWRGETIDFYTGRGWQNSMVVRTAGNEDFEPLPESAPVSKIEQVFSFYQGIGFQTVFSGGTIAGISQIDTNSLTTELQGITLLTDEGRNFYFAESKPVLSYRVLSYTPEVTNPPELTNSKLKYYSKNSSQSLLDVNPKYLQLPKIPTRVGTLAEKITQSAIGPYAKAKEIERFLSTKYPYDLTVKPLPPGRELTDFFLFDLKRGYCVYHSTAMVVMLRLVGIPARWVTGFTTGEYLPEKGAYKVKLSDAHAWVEAYINGVGWIPFEPTADFTLPEANMIEPALVSEKPGQQSIKPSVSSTNKATGISTPEIVLLVVSVGTLIMLLIKIRNKRRYKRGTQDFYKEFLQLMSRKGYHKDAALTPFEFAIQLKSTGKFDHSFDEIMFITRAYEKHRFSPTPLEYLEEIEIITILNKLAHKLK